MNRKAEGRADRNTPAPMTLLHASVNAENRDNMIKGVGARHLSIALALCLLVIATNSAATPLPSLPDSSTAASNPRQHRKSSLTSVACDTAAAAGEAPFAWRSLDAANQDRRGDRVWRWRDARLSCIPL